MKFQFLVNVRIIIYLIKVVQRLSGTSILEETTFPPLRFHCMLPLSLKDLHISVLVKVVDSRPTHCKALDFILTILILFRIVI